jgi:hypothetical protein
MIAKEMELPWRAVESMHWQMGQEDLASRANVPVFQSHIPNKSSSSTTASRRKNSRSPTNTNMTAPATATTTATTSPTASSTRGKMEVDEDSEGSPSEWRRDSLQNEQGETPIKIEDAFGTHEGHKSPTEMSEARRRSSSIAMMHGEDEEGGEVDTRRTSTVSEKETSGTLQQQSAHFGASPSAEGGRSPDSKERGADEEQVSERRDDEEG